ncbi:MAG: hypothetical protein AAFX55_00545 [Bacteroidota bacterium]
MKKLTYPILLLVLVFACSSDSDSASPNNNDDGGNEIELPVVTTQNPSIDFLEIRFNGTIVSEGDGIFTRGFCWAENTNPTIADSFQDASGSGLGPYFTDVGIFGVFEPGETYNVRAYAGANANGEMVYGNNISFTMPEKYVVNLDIVRNIEATRAEIMAEVESLDPATSSVVEKGFVYHTSSNVGINNGIVVDNSSTDLGEFQEALENLAIAQDYYLIAYAYDGIEYFYSDVVPFSTMGAVGASGGYVFFDKGEMTDGWRYLEAAPEDLVYSGSTQIKWGCTGTNIALTSRDLGTGLENTNRIVQGCAAANCAARLCDNYVVNNVDDWFLPSLDEMIYLDSSLSSLIVLGNSIDQVHWTSTQYTSSQARNYNSYLSFAPGFGVSKSNDCFVRPVRRF